MDRLKILKVSAVILLGFSYAGPLIDIEATDYIALWECRDGKMVRVWTAEDLTEEELEDIREYDRKLEKAECEEPSREDRSR